MKNKLFLFIVLAVVPLNVLAQNKPSSRNMTLEQLMEEKIRMLKNGALLIRLQTKENSITALRKAGNESQANQVETKQMAYNKEIVAAIRTEFKFCPVYFFSSKYSDAIRNGNLDSVVFVNDSLLPDPSIKVTHENYLTAEFGSLDPDTAAYYEGRYYEYGDAGVTNTKSYYSGADMGFDVFKIMNTNFIQLKKPFPYYVRTYDSMPVKKKISKAVKQMDKELSAYYKMSGGK